MKQSEFDKCRARLNISEHQLLKLVDATDKKAIGPDQARCIRALVLHEDIRDLVMRAKQEWPDAVFTGVRALNEPS